MANSGRHRAAPAHRNDAHPSRLRRREPVAAAGGAVLVAVIGTCSSWAHHALTNPAPPATTAVASQVALRATTPAPGLLSGAAAFKVLYRIRALLQTAEVHRSAARDDRELARAFREQPI